MGVYPRYKSARSYTTEEREDDEEHTVECAACANRSSGYLTIERSESPADDERYRVCARHRDMVQGDIGNEKAVLRFDSHVKTKAEWRVSKDRANIKYQQSR